MKRAIPLLVAALALGCASAPDDKKDKGNAATPDIYEVAWNITDAQLPPVSTLADIGGTVVFFGETSLIVMAEGEVQGHTEVTAPFRGAAVIPAADGIGRWVVGLDHTGRVLRVRVHDASIEDVSGRYGLETTEVRAISALGDSEGVAFLLADGIAIADGEKVRHWTLGAARSFSASATKIAIITDDGVSLFDIATSTLVKYPVAGARGAAFAADGRLFITVGRTLYVEAEGRLVEVRSAASEFHSLVRAGNRIWFGAGDDIGVIDETGKVLVLNAAAVGVSALIPSSSGDVWAIASKGVARFAATGGNAGAAQAWEGEIKPIFDNNCAACHMPGGLAGIDLSTYDQWNVLRATLMKRVLVEQNMPPRNSKALSDPDREKIRAWLTGK